MYDDLVHDMKSIALELEAQPETREWTQDEMNDIEDIRNAALKLAREAGAILEEFTGIPDSLGGMTT